MTRDPGETTGVKRKLIDLVEVLMIAGAAFAAGAAAAGDLDPLIAFFTICVLIGGVVVLVRLFPRGPEAPPPQRKAREPEDLPPPPPRGTLASRMLAARGRRKAEPEPEPVPDAEGRAPADPPEAEPSPEPTHAEPAPADDTPLPPGFAPLIPRHQRSQGTRVLVVDEDENTRRMVTRILSRFDFDVESAPDAALALQLITEEAPPQLLLTELMLPGMTGTALRSRVTAEAPDLAVVFMTSFAGSAKERYGLRPGIDTVIEKPFEAADLLAAVDQALTIEDEGI